MSWINFVLSWVEHGKKFYNLRAWFPILSKLAKVRPTMNVNVPAFTVTKKLYLLQLIGLGGVLSDTQDRLSCWRFVTSSAHEPGLRWAIQRPRILLSWFICYVLPSRSNFNYTHFPLGKISWRLKTKTKYVVQPELSPRPSIRQIWTSPSPFRIVLFSNCKWTVC